MSNKPVSADTATQIAEVRARLRAIQTEHAGVGAKFNAYVQPLQKMCNDHLRRTEFAPYMQVEAAKVKVVKRQEQLVAEVREIEARLAALMEKLDGEYAGSVVPFQKPSAPVVEPAPTSADEVSETSSAEDSAADFNI